MERERYGKHKSIKIRADEEGKAEKRYNKTSGASFVVINVRMQKPKVKHHSSLSQHNPPSRSKEKNNQKNIDGGIQERFGFARDKHERQVAGFDP